MSPFLDLWFFYELLPVVIFCDGFFFFFCGRWAEQKLIGVMMKVLTVFFFCSLLTLTEVGKDHHYTFIFISKFHDYFAGVFGLLCQSQSLFNSLSSGPSYHWVMMFFFLHDGFQESLCQPLQLQRLLIGSVTFTYDIPLNPISHCA